MDIKKNAKEQKFLLLYCIIGIPISINISAGNVHDSKIFLKQLDDDNLINKSILTNNIKYFLADTGYDTKEIRETIKKLGYGTPIIQYNKRNYKYIPTPKLTYKESKIYKNRIKIEHTNNKIKNIARANIRFDKSLKIFKNSVYFACLMLIINKYSIE